MHTSYIMFVHKLIAGGAAVSKACASCLSVVRGPRVDSHACLVQPPRTSEDTGVHAERDPRRNGMDNPFGAGIEPLHPQLALLTG